MDGSCGIAYICQCAKGSVNHRAVSNKAVSMHPMWAMCSDSAMKIVSKFLPSICCCCSAVAKSLICLRRTAQKANKQPQKQQQQPTNTTRITHGEAKRKTMHEMERTWLLVCASMSASVSALGFYAFDCFGCCLLAFKYVLNAGWI